MMSPDDLKARVLAAVRATPAPTKRTLQLRAALLVGSGAALLFAVFFLGPHIYGAPGGVRQGARPLSLIIGTVVGAAAVALFALWGALGRGRSMLGRSRAWLLAVSCTAPILLLAWKLLWSSRYEHMTDEDPKRLGLKCLTLSLAMAAWPLLALALLRGSTDPIHPAATGAAFGVAAGSCAWVLTDLWCPVAYPPHLLLGHVLPIAILGLLGAALGSRVIALRRE